MPRVADLVALVSSTKQLTLHLRAMFGEGLQVRVMIRITEVNLRWQLQNVLLATFQYTHVLCAAARAFVNVPFCKAVHYSGVYNACLWPGWEIKVLLELGGPMLHKARGTCWVMQVDLGQDVVKIISCSNERHCTLLLLNASRNLG